MNKKNLILITAIIISVIFNGVLWVNHNKAEIYSRMKAWKLVPMPETLTELSFDNHLLLPKKLTSSGFVFSFTVHNLEFQDMRYTYEIKAINEVKESLLEKGHFYLSHDKHQTLSRGFGLKNLNFRTKVEIRLVEKDQYIHFWMEVPV